MLGDVPSNEIFDLAAGGAALEPADDMGILDEDEGRHFVHMKLLHERRIAVYVDVDNPEPLLLRHPYPRQQTVHSP